MPFQNCHTPAPEGLVGHQTAVVGADKDEVAVEEDAGDGALVHTDALEGRARAHVRDSPEAPAAEGEQGPVREVEGLDGPQVARDGDLASAVPRPDPHLRRRAPRRRPPCVRLRVARASRVRVAGARCGCASRVRGVGAHWVPSGACWVCQMSCSTVPGPAGVVEPIVPPRFWRLRYHRG